jgi:hypothetical protein
MRMTFPTTLVGCLMVISTVSAPAQPLFDAAESLECIVTDADHMALGRLAGIPCGLGATSLTLDVEATLKGEHRCRMTLRAVSS